MIRRPGNLVLLIGVFGVLTSCGRAQDELRLIADVTMQAPDGRGRFTTFASLQGVSPGISGENVVFGAGAENAAGTYAMIDGELIVIADTMTPVPGSVVNFGTAMSFGTSPSISGRNIVFAGPTPKFGDAIWAWFDGELQHIAGTDTPVPGSPGTFRSFASNTGNGPAIDGRNITFMGIRDDDGSKGLYAYINGELEVIADISTPVPGEAVNFLAIGSLGGTSPSISGENIAFGASWDAGGGFVHFGIFARIGGELRSIVKGGDARPEGAPPIGTIFGNFGFNTGTGPGISGENVVFCDPGGIYAYMNNELRKIADLNTSFPGIEGTITTFDAFGGASPSISGENITFVAAGPGLGTAIIAYIDGELEIVADQNTPVPGRDFNFFDSSFLSNGTSPYISGRNVVFSAQPPGGVYARIHTPPIPTVSTWGLIALALMCLTFGTLVLRQRLRAPIEA